MSEVTITKQNFESEVINSDKPVLIDFWASWCGPCSALSPVISSFADKHEEIKVGKVNVDDEQELAMKFNVMSIPTVILFKNGKAVKQQVGVSDLAGLERQFT